MSDAKGYRQAIERLAYECFLEQIKIMQRGDFEVLRVLALPPGLAVEEGSDWGNFMKNGAQIFETIHDTYGVLFDQMEEDLSQAIDLCHERAGLPKNRLN